MHRVAVIGTGGAGKSTFAKELGRRLELDVIHLDELHWRPGWVPTPASEWRAIQLDLVSRPNWVIDGNYGGTLDVRLAAADVVIFFDMPRRVAIAGILHRWLINRGLEIQAYGCPGQERPHLPLPHPESHSVGQRAPRRAERHRSADGNWPVDWDAGT